MDASDVTDPEDDLIAAEYPPPDEGGPESASGSEEYLPTVRPSPSLAAGPLPRLPKAPTPAHPSPTATVDQDAGDSVVRAVSVLPLGAGLALVGLGLGFLGLRLRRS